MGLPRLPGQAIAGSDGPNYCTSPRTDLGRTGSQADPFDSEFEHDPFKLSAISAGVDHAEYEANTSALPEAVRASLASDLR